LHAGRTALAVTDAITGQRLGTAGPSSRSLSLTIAPSQTRVLSLASLPAHSH
jgi:hypothetical protein